MDYRLFHVLYHCKLFCEVYLPHKVETAKAGLKNVGRRIKVQGLWREIKEKHMEEAEKQFSTTSMDGIMP